MSYEIYLFPADNTSLTPESFTNYFSGLKNFYMNNTVAHYENKSTGVYFLFELFCSSSKEYYVNFHMNFVRPSFFAIEAEPQVKAFVEAFHCSVKDDQMGGMSNGEYDSSGFLKGWYIGNEHGCRSAVEQGAQVPMYQQEELIGNWRWNYNKENMQSALGENIFVPTIQYCKHNSKTVSYVVWSDADPIFMPQVDIIIIMKMHKLYDPNNPNSITFMCEWNDLAQEFKKHPYVSDVKAYNLGSPTAQNSLLEAVKKLPNLPDPKNQLAFDTILDAEVCQPAITGRS